MAPRLIIAGLSQAVVRRAKGFAPDIPTWDTRYIHSEVAKSDLASCWPKVLFASNQPSHHGTHILAFHFRVDQRSRFERDVRGRHRLVWMDMALAGKWGTTDFIQRLQEMADFEMEWRGAIRPPGVSSPLMLPESAFDAAAAVAPIWARAQRVQAGRDALAAVVPLAKRFRLEHYRRAAWVDIRERNFAVATARHAFHVPADRRWKFTFPIPQGFHYDVSALKGGRFNIRDHTRASQAVRQHVNVDCHGYLRRGR